jgi:hypothetical protein
MAELAEDAERTDNQEPIADRERMIDDVAMHISLISDVKEPTQ